VLKSYIKFSFLFLVILSSQLLAAEIRVQANCPFILKNFRVLRANSNLVEVPRGFVPWIATDRLVLGSPTGRNPSGYQDVIHIYERESLKYLGDLNFEISHLAAHLPIELVERFNSKTPSKGIGTESKFALISLVFDQFSAVTHIWARIDPKNANSISLHKKLGFEMGISWNWYLPRERFENQTRLEFQKGVKTFAPQTHPMLRKIRHLLRQIPK
jgi:hypothetical protein